MDGTPLITFRTEPNLVVDLNFFPTHGQWDQETDGWVMLKNAINWTTRSFTPKWLSGNPMSGVVNGNSEGSMDLAFDSSDLGEGNYSAEVQFSSNDPVNPFFAVEVLLEVQENQAPIASSKTLYLKEDGSLQFSLDAIDPDGDGLTYLITNLPTSGSLEGENHNFTYTPAKNFNGHDSLTFKVTDGRKESNLATVSFEIEAVNDTPWAQSFEVNATEDEFFTVDFNYGDIDGDTLNLSISKYPTNGFLWEDNGQWLYFPNNHFNGEDTFRYFVNDGLLDSTEAIALVRLKAQNDAPVANNVEINTNEDSSVSFELSASDVDNDSLTYRVVQDPIHGRLSQGGNSNFTYSPFNEYSGQDSFTFQAFDGKVYSNIGSVKITITEVNDPPVVQSSTFKLREDSNIAIKLIASDPEGDSLTFSLISGPMNGSITGTGPSYSYTPSRDFNGVDSFEVQASDGELTSNVALITLNVESQNDAPYFEYNLATLSGGVRETPMRIKLQAKDIDNDEVSISLSSSPSNGTCYIENEELIYLPSVGFSGIENISLELNDGNQSVIEELTLNVNSHEDPFKINFDDQTDPLLINMLYQANEILLSRGKPVFQLEQSSDENSVSAAMSNDTNFTGQGLNEWLENIEGLPGTSFVFQAEEVENRLHWKVSSFLDPASSVDTDNNTSTDSSEGGSQDSTEETKDEKNGSQEEESEENEVADNPAVEELPFIENLGSNWYNAQGIGVFFDSGDGWIYQVDMGWCYLKICSDQNSFWIFHESLGWFWMSQELPNMLYLVNESSSGWFYFPFDNLTESNFIYGYENQAWLQWKE